MTVGGNSAYSAYSADSAHAGRGGLPPLVESAVELAAGLGFDHSCAPEQGRLLAVLARGWSGGRIGEIPAGAPGAAERDTARRHWLEHPLLHATEIRLSPTLATIVAVRVR